MPRLARSPRPEQDRGLPPHYLPRVAAYARGPWIEPRLVTPSDFQWKGARTYVVEDYDGVTWRCLRVTVDYHEVGYWAIEFLGLPLPIGSETAQRRAAAYTRLLRAILRDD